MNPLERYKYNVHNDIDSSFEENMKYSELACSYKDNHDYKRMK